MQPYWVFIPAFSCIQRLKGAVTAFWQNPRERYNSDCAQINVFICNEIVSYGYSFGVLGMVHALGSAADCACFAISCIAKSAVAAESVAAG
jgi:hypothetical protein